MRIEAAGRLRRRPSLTPLIDVVFILLVFFMLVTRFVEFGEMSIDVVERQGAAATESRSTLVRVEADAILVDGRPFSTPEAVARTLARPGGANAAIRVEAAEGVVLQEVVDVVQALRGEGLERINWLR